MCVSAAAERENRISSPQAVEAAYSKTKQKKEHNCPPWSISSYCIYDKQKSNMTKCPVFVNWG